MEESQWTGGWVAERLGVQVTTTGSPAGRRVQDLVGLALRRNPRRAHLLVSAVLGKHVPVDPHVVLAAARDLGGLVAPLRPRLGAPAAALVVGYAETATALGHEVAGTLVRPTCTPPGARRRGPAAAAASRRSTATPPRTGCCPRDPGLLTPRPSAVVLVDDELSTGRTALDTIRALHAAHPPAHYVVAALVDLRDAGRPRAGDELARELGTRIDVVGLATGRVDLGDDVSDRGTAGPPCCSTPVPAAPAPPRRPCRRRRVATAWPPGVPEGGRHGFPPTHEPAYAARSTGSPPTLAPRPGGAGAGATCSAPRS